MIFLSLSMMISALALALFALSLPRSLGLLGASFVRRCCGQGAGTIDLSVMFLGEDTSNCLDLHGRRDGDRVGSLQDTCAEGAGSIDGLDEAPMHIVLMTRTILSTLDILIGDTAGWTGRDTSGEEKAAK